MLSIRILARHVQNKIISPSIFTSSTQNYSSSSASDDEKNKEKIKEDSKKKSGEALQKLNVLLKQMIEDDTHTETKSSLNLAKPKPRTRNTKTEPGTISAKSEPVEKQVIDAAKNVAETLGGDVKQTESELLSKLLNSAGIKPEETKEKSLNLSDIISGMKIDRSEKPKSTDNNETSRAHQVRRLLDQSSEKTTSSNTKKQFTKAIKKQRIVQKTQTESINLFGVEPLGIFTSKEAGASSKELMEMDEKVVLKTWNELQERELRLAVTHPPENYFQEMILWTEQGKVWKFPIDNEQGMEEEQSIYFTEHVFLDKHLEPWCPSRGPVRHFMELVCVGLSKNPYLSVDAKKDHILWYRDYFASKQKLLEEIGAIPAESAKKLEEIADK